MANDVPACEAHTALYTFGSDIVFVLTSNANGCLTTKYTTLRVRPRTLWFYGVCSYFIIPRCFPKQVMAYQRLSHEFSYIVAEDIPVYKIPRQSLKVWLCLPPGPLRHPPPAVNRHPAGSAPRQHPSAIPWGHVRAQSARGHPWLPARSIPPMPAAPVFGNLVMLWGTVATWVRCLPPPNGAGYLSPQWCG